MSHPAAIMFAAWGMSRRALVRLGLAPTPASHWVVPEIDLGSGAQALNRMGLALGRTNARCR
eukprot:6811763-Pyramimonas_sp.AAC.1